MNLRETFRAMDIERLILVPIFVFLLLTNLFGVYSYLQQHSATAVLTVLNVLHRVLVVGFYLLIIALFFLRSQARATTSSFMARFMAYAGTFTPFLLIFARDAEGSVAPTLLAICIMTVGMLFALYSLHYLGRSFGIMPQARNLVRTGPYRFIRHPLYAGEIVAFGGAILVDLTIYKMGIFVMLCAIQLYRAVQEEKLLEETIPEYTEYKTATTRFIPGLL